MRARLSALDPVWRTGLLLVLVQTAVRARVVPGSYFWQDDFHHLDLARRLGFSSDYLVRDYSGHLEIGQYAFIWLLGRGLSTSFLPAAVSLVLLQLVASLLLLAVLTSLWPRSPWVLVPFAVYLFSPLALVAATWWAAGLQAFPLQVAMFAGILGLVRSRAAGPHRVWWSALSVVAHAAGLLCWEKAVLVLPTLLAVDLLVLGAGRPWRDRLGALRRRRRYWTCQLVVLAAYVVLYVSVVQTPASATADRSRPAVAAEILLEVLLPGLYGGPWSTEGALNTVYPAVSWPLATFCGLLTVALVAVSVWLRGRRAWAGWALAAGFVAVDIVLVLLGRAEYLTLVARDPRYVTDALGVVAIGVCAAFAGPQRRPLPLLDPVLRAPALAAATVGAVVLGASGLITTFLLAPVVQHDYARNYVAGLVRSLEERPGASVYDSPAPTLVSASADNAALLRAVDHEYEFDRPGRQMYMVDLLAQLRPVELPSPRVDLRGDVADCGWAVHERPTALTTLADGLTDTAPVLRLGIVGGADAVVHVRVGDDEQGISVGPGLAEAYFVVGGQAGPLSVWVDAPSPGVCVTDLQVGAPWPKD